jgi:hypothetical protein
MVLIARIRNCRYRHHSARMHHSLPDSSGRSVGAVLLTGYLGGAGASQVRVSAPLFNILFPVILEVILETLYGRVCIFAIEGWSPFRQIADSDYLRIQEDGSASDNEPLYRRRGSEGGHLA